MLLKRDNIIQRPGELDRIVYELNLYADLSEDEIEKDLSQRGFRNVLVHLYQAVDIHILWLNFQKVNKVFPEFSKQILIWLDSSNL